MSKPNEALARLAARLCPGFVAVDVRPLGPDRDIADDTHKAIGYGAPQRIILRDREDNERSLVFHVVTPNAFGHDRRADRAAAQLLAFDTLARIPRHVPALDVGAIADDGRLVSLGGTGELYLVTAWADGTVYAEDLRRIAREGRASEGDVARVQALARYLAGLHHVRGGAPPVYRRAIRDLVGHGEGIFGIIDGYPEDCAGAPASWLRDIELACVRWRWKLRDRYHRLATTHGDFHPFNIVFSTGNDFTLLDASRGCAGDPADDVAALVINFVFFALDHANGWRGLGPLWHGFWRTYLEASDDGELLEVVAPFLAWRALVVASPAFYPSLPERERARILGFAARALDRDRFDPGDADDLFP
jgi:hypothetical protein